MKIEIDDSYDKSFIYYIKDYLLNSIVGNIDRHRKNDFKNEFNIDIENIILFAIKTLSIKHINDYYIIEIDNNKFYNDMNLKKLIDLITYGNRNVKGYTLLLKLFNVIQNNIPELYRR